MPIDAKYAPFAKETATCVDLAYDATEGDILAEIEAANDETRTALSRLLSKLRERRAVLDEFARQTTKAA